MPSGLATNASSKPSPLNKLPYRGSTYSKTGVADPAFDRLATHADGWRVFAEGRDYLDMSMGLGSVILGHRHPEVDDAIRRQLANGTTFSLATKIEHEAAARVLAHFPDSCMLQWGTNGSDATEGAIRLARLVTGRDQIIMATDGYHGFHDWSLLGTERGHGIRGGPWVTRIGHLIHLEHLVGLSIEANEIAAVILEPDLRPEWLKPVREWCTKHGALMIADEVNCWQRYPEWTASAHYDVTPDLWCLGKSLGNGMPVSAIVGPKNFIDRFSPGSVSAGVGSARPNAFFSSTWAGHPLSMAAVIATLDVMERESGPSLIWRKAQGLTLFLDAAIMPTLIGKMISHKSKAPFNRISFKSPKIARAWRKAMSEQGVLIYGAHNLSLAHDDNAMTRLGNAWRAFSETFPDWMDEMQGQEEEAQEMGIMRR